ncbi:acetyltransferase [Arenibacter algicola]|uniref:Putative acetyltransferase EpsM n=1 Tax=Arenibacter algicola TaxID=616991 RepID=A0A221UZ76_9FLAO|nr:acetyltransferase [Arenibacter algicola]ASO06654.1 putative acetyltransferase EpsM [Arenibacter algicola]
MKHIDTSMKKLTILGFYPQRLNLLMELGYDSNGYETFDVLQNIGVKEELSDYVENTYFDVRFHETYLEEKFDSFQKSSFAFGVIGIKSKEMVFDYFKKFNIKKTQFPNLIHPSCVISNSVELNKGIQIESLCSITVLAKIGFGVNIKRNSAIGHHCVINDYVTINPGAIISSFVEIGKNTLIGTGVVIKDKISIGENTIIGSGSNVTKDIPSNSIAYGNPCVVHRINKV